MYIYVACDGSNLITLVCHVYIIAELLSEATNCDALLLHVCMYAYVIYIVQ